ncbi:MAG: DinB family protein [Chloroflexi bacterium]|nr:DinB family protein [Chloroflexota bacterium]
MALTIDPFEKENYQDLHIGATRDFLVLLLCSIQQEARTTLDDLKEEELHWEPLTPAATAADLRLPAQDKKVWRVFHDGRRWTYDYADGNLDPPPFTTIAWIMNHIAQTADMYLYCINTNQPVGQEITWDDLPVHHELASLRAYIDQVLDQTLALLQSFDPAGCDRFLNQITPAPWGEMRPTVLNLLGGVLQHALQHLMQISVRKEYIRFWSGNQR